MAGDAGRFEGKEEMVWDLVVLKSMKVLPLSEIGYDFTHGY